MDSLSVEVTSSHNSEVETETISKNVTVHENVEKSLETVRNRGGSWTFIGSMQSLKNIKNSIGSSQAFNYVTNQLNPQKKTGKVLTFVIATGAMTAGWWIANPGNPGNTVLAAAIISAAVNLIYTVGQDKLQNYMKNGGDKLHNFAQKMGLPLNKTPEIKRRSVIMSRLSTMLPIDFVQNSMYQFAVLLAVTASATPEAAEFLTRETLAKIADPVFLETTKNLIIQSFTSLDVLYRTVVNTFGVTAATAYLYSKRTQWGEGKFQLLWAGRVLGFSILGALMINNYSIAEIPVAKIAVSSLGALAFASLMKPTDKTLYRWLVDGMNNKAQRAATLFSPKKRRALLCLRAGH